MWHRTARVEIAGTEMRETTLYGKRCITYVCSILQSTFHTIIISIIIIIKAERHNNIIV